jgi:transposase
METIHPICCGLDVHQASVSACLRRVNVQGAVSVESREFGTTVKELVALADWLVAEGCPIAAMESTGVYWKPVWNILSPLLDVWVVNAREVKQRRGKKSDRADAKWIAELVAHDLVQPSFVPPARIGVLRDLVRMRTVLVQGRTQVKNRVLAVLEDTNVKLASVVSDPFGASARKMMEALVNGQRDCKVLSEMAKGVLRRKIPQLEVALQGGFTEHHAFMIRLGLESLDQSNRQIAELDAQIERLMDPLQEEALRLTSIPGVGQNAARVVLSEIGTDMSRFGSAERLASWAECAWAASKTNTFLGRTFRRFQIRIGGKKAAVAVGHKMLVIIFHLLNEGRLYDDGRYDQVSQREQIRQRNRAMTTLQRLGYQVVLTTTP